MHVALIGPFALGTAGSRGGVESSLTRLAYGLAGDGVQVTVLTPGEPGTGGDGSNPRIVPLRGRGIPLLPPERLLFPRAFRPWRRAVRAELEDVRPDLVHGHGLLSHGLATTDWGAGPRVITAHGNPARDLFNQYRGVRGTLTGQVAATLARRTVARADCVVGATPDPRVNLPRRPRRFLHIPNVVDDAFFAVVPEPIPGRVLYCGGARFIKGWDVLARAWPAVMRALPGAELVAAGLGPEAVGGLAGVRVLPSLQPSGLAEEMSRASVVVVPSRFEVSPNVVAEAWAAGLPVVASAVGGVPIMAGGAAAIVAPEDPAALATALVDVLTDAGGDTVGRIRAEGRRRVQAYRVEAVVARHRRLYEATLAGSASVALGGTGDELERGDPAELGPAPEART
ncbi:MAG: hypothetical protein QOE86_2563 [Solirubrobacteraceae bacterium]|nr:hypothetical protein [Solirubrobacteraceae bacterium]